MGVGAAGDERLRTHFAAVLDGFSAGRVTPVLGAGASLCSRPALADDAWLGVYPPSAGELAAYLARRVRFPGPAETLNLLEVCQYAAALNGVQALYDHLHDVFDVEFRPSPLHVLLAELPSVLARRSRLARPPLFVTTNYDDLLELALAEAGVEFDLVVYLAEGKHAGKLAHRAPGGGLEPIITPISQYLDVDPNNRTVVLKIHGFVDRHADEPRDSFVITEDHYISYLTRLDLDKLLPLKVLTRLQNCHLLFLGYSLSDWNLRAMLYQLSADQLSADRRLNRKWWAILRSPTVTEVESWRLRDVELFDLPLEEWVDGLSERLAEGLTG